MYRDFAIMEKKKKIMEDKAMDSFIKRIVEQVVPSSLSSPQDVTPRAGGGAVPQDPVAALTQAFSDYDRAKTRLGQLCYKMGASLRRKPMHEAMPLFIAAFFRADFTEDDVPSIFRNAFKAGYEGTDHRWKVGATTHDSKK